MTCLGCPGGCSRCSDSYALERSYKNERALREIAERQRENAAEAMRIARRDVFAALRKATTDYPTLRLIADVEARFRAEGKV